MTKSSSSASKTERAAKYQRTYRKKHGQKVYLKDAKIRYGLEPEEYERLFAACEGLCMICHLLPATRLHIDHCHSSRKVRGLLCVGCNHGLGSFKDSLGNLRNAMQYLLERG
jgi:hypothetical protein